MDTNKPLVSIIVVSYNQGKFIRENLTTVRDQTYNNWELTVADDASTDNSKLVFDEFLELNQIRANKVYHESNKGLAATLNECIELCNGEFIKLIAADDYLHPDYLRLCVDRLLEGGKEYGMVFTDTYAVDENSSLLNDISNYNALVDVPANMYKKRLIAGNCIPALTVMLTREALKNTGPYINTLLEDYFRWLKVSEKYSIAFIPKKLTYYRQHGHNISILKSDEIEREALLLQMQFDSNGDASTIISNKILTLYVQKKITDKLLISYHNYPFNNKLLYKVMNLKLPYLVYRILNKVL